MLIHDKLHQLPMSPQKVDNLQIHHHTPLKLPLQLHIHSFHNLDTSILVLDLVPADDFGDEGQKLNGEGGRETLEVAFTQG